MSALALALLSGVVGALAQTAATPPAEKVLEKLQEKLRLGKYAAIDRALLGAWDDVVATCENEMQRQMVDQVLEGLLESESSVLLDEFSEQVTQIYLLPSPKSPSHDALAKSYRKISGVVAILHDQVPSEKQLIEIFGAFFAAFR